MLRVKDFLPVSAEFENTVCHYVKYFSEWIET